MKHRKCHVTDKWRQFACAFARARVCVYVRVSSCARAYHLLYMDISPMILMLLHVHLL